LNGLDHKSKNSGDKVIVGLSGGVDSAVAALLLKRRGFVVEGLFMKNWEEDDDTGLCTAQADLESARRVCERLDITLHTANFAAEYWDCVFTEFLAEYRAGRTPNPDILCNREIKFKVFANYSRLLGADCIATGHYARMACAPDGGPLLCTSRDTAKDQTYFLCATPRMQFERVLFPLGDLDKTNVRHMAAAAGLPNHARKDSTGICFIGKRRFGDFLRRYLRPRPGPVMDFNGVVLGRHQGLMYHTLGQRQGLGIGGYRNGDGKAWYVAAKDLRHNALLVVQGNDHPSLFSRSLCAGPINWLVPPPEMPFRCALKLRHRQPVQPGEIDIDPIHSEWIHVRFEHRQRAVTPGQFLALYDRGTCLGGGVIRTVENHPLRNLPSPDCTEPVHAPGFMKPEVVPDRHRANENP